MQNIFAGLKFLFIGVIASANSIIAPAFPFINKPNTINYKVASESASLIPSTSLTATQTQEISLSRELIPI